MLDPAFAAFVGEHRPALVRALTLYCGDAGVAEELVHEAFVRVGERWERLRTVGPPVAYTRRVAINLANSRFRRRAAERRALARVAAGADVAHHDPCGADGLAVRRAVAALPPRQREVVVRRWFLGESVDEVAAATGLVPSSVRAADTRAVARLRAALDLPTTTTATEARDGS